MPGADPWPAGIDRVPAHEAIHRQMPELLRPELPAESLLRLNEHIAQVGRYIDGFFGFDQWFLVDTRGAAHRDPALSLLRYTAHWDPYGA